RQEAATRMDPRPDPTCACRGLPAHGGGNRIGGGMTDQTFTKERPGFLERLGRLAGQTTYRVPIEGVGTKFDHIPESHGLIVSLCGARGPRWQPGPEIAFAMATGIQHQRE